MAAARAAKRPRLASASPAAAQSVEDDYVPGNIVEIELRNFMTYDSLACRLPPWPAPQPRRRPQRLRQELHRICHRTRPRRRPTHSREGIQRRSIRQGGGLRPYQDIPPRGYGRRQHLHYQEDRHQQQVRVAANGATVPRKEVIDVIKKFNIQVNNSG